MVRFWTVLSNKKYYTCRMLSENLYYREIGTILKLYRFDTISDEIISYMYCTCVYYVFEVIVNTF